MRDLDREFMDFMKKVNTSMGFDANASELIALLYIEPTEISLEDLAKRTGYSLASASVKMKMLEEFAIVQRIRKPGTRKVYYYMEKNIARLVRNRMSTIYTHKILPSKRYIPQLLLRYKSAQQTESTRKKVRILTDYIRQIEKVERALGKAIEELKEDK